MSQIKTRADALNILRASKHPDDKAVASVAPAIETPDLIEAARLSAERPIIDSADKARAWLKDFAPAAYARLEQAEKTHGYTVGDHMLIAAVNERIADLCDARRSRQRFTDDQVRAMRKAHENGATIYRLAKDYQCSTGTIWNIVHGKSRKDVE